MLQNVKAVDVYDFGATPMSSIKAPVDVRLQAEDYHVLPRAAARVAAALGEVKGLTSVSTSWDNDFTEARLNIDTNRAPGLWHDAGADCGPASPGRHSGGGQRQPCLHAESVCAPLFQPAV
ncbi:MAG: hypothetical protein U5J82_01230 [Desulfobacterales bacterium]|nr:hypothetical protein [Desulfobacterales bacterium]